MFQHHNTDRDILRINYFTCVVGDRVKLEGVRDRISAIEYSCTVGVVGSGGDRYSGGGPKAITNKGTLNPRVFVKKKDQPRKMIDVAIVIDAINYSMRDNIDEIHIVSADSDFIPVIHEIMRRGKRVTVSSFSCGINDEMKHAPDTYECLDDVFFDKKEEVEKPAPHVNAEATESAIEQEK